jgi:hypothetical protein
LSLVFSDGGIFIAEEFRIVVIPGNTIEIEAIDPTQVQHSRSTGMPVSPLLADLDAQIAGLKAGAGSQAPYGVKLCTGRQWITGKVISYHELSG